MTQPVPNVAGANEPRVPVRDSTGTVGTIPASQLEAALSTGGYSPATPEELAEATRKAAAQDTPWVVPIAQGIADTTLAIPAAAATLAGQGDIAERISVPGIVAKWNALEQGMTPEQEEAEFRRQQQTYADVADESPYLYGGGKLAGYVSQTAMTGGLGGLASKGTASLLARAGVGGAGTGLLGRTAARVLPTVASEATQGAIIGAQEYTAEGALGNHDLRAQELLAAAGGGALIGAVLGGGLGLAGAAGGELKRAVVAGTGETELGAALLSRGKQVAGKLGEGVDSVLEGIRPQADEFAKAHGRKGLGGMMKENAKFEKLAPNVLARADNMILEEIPARAGYKVVGVEKELAVAKEIFHEAEHGIGATLKELDALQPKVVNAAKLADKLDGMAAELKTAGMGPERRAVRKWANELRQSYGTFDDAGNLIEARTTLEEMHRARVRLDKEVFDLNGQKKGVIADQLRNVRGVIESEIEKEADRLAATIANDSPLKGAYQKYKVDYAAAKTIRNAAERGVRGLNTNRMGGLGEHLAGMFGGFVGSMAGGPVGSIAGAGIAGTGAWVAKHYGDQWMAQSANIIAKGGKIADVAAMTKEEIMRGVRRAIGSDIGKGIVPAAQQGLERAKGLLGPVVDTGVKTVRTAGRLAAKGAGVAGSVGKIETIKSLNPLQYERVREEVQQRKNDPTIIAAQVMATGLPETHPNIAKSLIKTAQNANDHLAAKLPPEVTRPSLSGPKTLPPTEQQLRDVALLIRAIDDPLSILDDLRADDVSPQTVETLRKVYPDLYSEIETEVRIAVAGNEKIPYEKRISLGIMFSEPVDPTLTPEYLQTMRVVSGMKMPERQAKGSVTSGNVFSETSSILNQVKPAAPPPARAQKPAASLLTGPQRLSNR